MIDNPELVYNVLQKKCSFKKIEIPTFRHIESHEKLDELEPQWENMLVHQLPHLPPMASFWLDLSPFFEWLQGQLTEDTLVSVSPKDEIVFKPGRIFDAYSMDSILHKIQFAAANRICVELEYSDRVRTVEPLSFRTAKSGNTLFYGFERDAGHAKAYTLRKIQSVEITNLAYTEKYPVEISSSGYISMPPIRRKRSGFNSTSYNVRTTRRKEPKYKYQCPLCNKYFYRKNNNSRLNAHKNKDGWPCSGRMGIYIGYS